jgi:hypothetical protein
MYAISLGSQIGRDLFHIQLNPRSKSSPACRGGPSQEARGVPAGTSVG